jgi:hypothetical protein
VDRIQLLFLQVGVASGRQRGDIFAVKATVAEGGHSVIVVVPVVVAGARFEPDRTVESREQARGERRFAGVDAGVTGDK